MADDKDKDDQLVTKFKGDNYNIWASRIKDFLASKGLAEHLKEDQPSDIWQESPNDSTEVALKKQEKREKFKADNSKALGHIRMRVSDSLLSSVQSLNSAKEVWETLEKLHKKTGQTSMVRLRTQLQKVAFEPESARKCTAEMESLKMQIVAAGGKIEEEEMVSALLVKLDKVWPEVGLAIELRPEPMSWAELTKYLHGRSDVAKDEVDLVQASAANVRASSKRDKRCNNCGKKGHFMADCWLKGGGKAGQWPRKGKGKSHGKGSESSANSAVLFTCRVTVDVEEASASAQSVAAEADAWIVDSGASHHFSPDKSKFCRYEKLKKPLNVITPGSQVIEAVGRGDIEVAIESRNGKHTRVKLIGVLHADGIRVNLISVPTLTRRGLVTTFGDMKVTISKDGDMKAEGRLSNVSNLFIIKEQEFGIASANAVSVAPKDTSVMWHRRLGHPSTKVLKSTSRIVDGMKLTDEELKTDPKWCEPCGLGKMTKKATHRESARKREINAKLELVATDLCGPMQKQSHGGALYFMPFMDVKTRWAEVALLKTKGGAVAALKAMMNRCQTATGEKIKAIRHDGGGEFVNEEVSQLISSLGIVVEKTNPASSSTQNGAVERINRTLQEDIGAMLAQANLPYEYWGEAALTAAYVRNRRYTSANKDGMTPHESFTGKRPDLRHLRAFGCLAIVHVPKRRKLDPKGRRCIMLGYSSMGYRLLDITTRKVITSKDCIFNENVFPGLDKTTSPQNIEWEVDSDSDDEGSETQGGSEEWEQGNSESNDTEECRSDVNPNSGSDSTVTKSGRISRKPTRMGSWWNASANMLSIYGLEGVIPIPESAAEAIRDQGWKDSMKKEWDRLVERKTWKMVPRSDRKTVKSRWVFDVKYTPTGDFIRKRSRVVAKGFSQVHGIDYNETYAPVCKTTTARVLLAVAAVDEDDISVFDISGAFLYGDLKEEIHMEMPDEAKSLFPEDQDVGDVVLQLNKSIYGLKQAQKCFKTKLDDVEQKIGFQPTKSDQCLYVRRGGSIEAQLFHVDDGLVKSKSTDKVIKEVASHFDVRSQGLSDGFLSVEIVRDRKAKKIGMFQKTRALGIVKSMGLENAAESDTPSNLQVLPPVADGHEVTNVPYRQGVGLLRFLADYTRPDIQWALHHVSRHLEKHGKDHWKAVKRIGRYVKGSANEGLVFDGSSGAVVLDAYVDAAFAQDPKDRKSTFGWVCRINGTAVSWKVKKDSVVAQSTMEAEYAAMAELFREILWLIGLLAELGWKQEPVIVNEDNQAAIRLSGSEDVHERSKHFAVKYFFVKELVREGKVKVVYCPTASMVADMLTKPLAAEKITLFKEKLGMAARDSVEWES